MNLKTFYTESNKIITTAQGGNQSQIFEVPTEIPPHALLALARVMGEGAAKYGSKNWHKISVDSEIDHSMRHALRYLANKDYMTDTDVQFEELAHYAARALMALDQFIREQTAELIAEEQNETLPCTPD